MRINEQIILDYLKLVEKIPTIIEAYGLKSEYLIKQSKISKATFYRKVDGKVWAKQAKETLKLAKAINR